jgi:hypothetical protein
VTRVSTSGPSTLDPWKTFTVTCGSSPTSVPPTPEKVGVASFVELPFAGCVSVTTGGALISQP